MANLAGSDIPLETLGDDGSVPRSRLNDARCVHEICERLIEANAGRSAADAEVFAQISGKLPYSEAILEREGQLWRFNFPSRIGEATFNDALGQYNDTILEARQYAVVHTAHGRDEDEKEEYDVIINEEFQRLNKRDDCLFYNLSLSQFEMVLYRCGPMIYDNQFDFRAKAIPQRYCLVPDGSRSTVSEWQMACVRTNYTCDELYATIQSPAMAEKSGADVAAIRKAIMGAIPSDMWGRNRRNDWEWLEQRLRNNDLYFGTVVESIPVSHLYYREFPRSGETEGKISRASVLEGDASSNFLWRKIDHYDKWQHVINPFYYDRGDGTHHSVKGMGIKGYGAWKAYDFMACHMADAALLAGSMHFQAATTNDLENLSVTAVGPYMWHPPGGSYLQTQGLGSSIDATLAVKQDLLNTVSNNLNQYKRQLSNTSRDRVTKREVDYQAGQESLVNKSTMVRYYEQLDDFWAERFRRAANPNLTAKNPGGRDALEFQKRCKDRGVPRKCLDMVDSVTAWRTVGFGSADARRQGLDRMMERLPLYNEDERQNIIEDVTASDVGYANLRRYQKRGKVETGSLDQQADATDKVAGMKVGVSPVITPSQNPVIYAGVWIQAADAAAGTVAQTNGATAKDVFSFLEIAGPAINAQLQRIKKDPSRKQQFDDFTQHWKQLAALHDKLGAQLKQQANQARQKQAELQKQKMESESSMAIKAKETQAKVQMSQWKAQEQMNLKKASQAQNAAIQRQQHAQGMVIADAEAATDIRNKTLKAKASAAPKPKAK